MSISTRVTFAFSTFLALNSLMGQDIPENWYFLRPGKTGISGDYHHVITEDAHGNIWTGGYDPFFSDGSVVRYDGDIWTCWGNYDGYLPNERVNAIAFSPNGELWVGSDEGISHYNGQIWETFNTQNSNLASNKVIDLAIEPDGTVWAATGEVGSLQGGISKYTLGVWTEYTSENSNLQSESISSIDADIAGNLWIGTNLGLIKFDGLNWILYTNINSELEQNVIYDIQISNNGWLYILNSNVLQRFNGSNWETIQTFSTDTYRNMDVEGDQVLAVQNNNSGQAQYFDGSTWSILNPNMIMYGAEIASDGSLWVAGITYVKKYQDGQWTNYSRYNTGLAEYFNEDIFIDSQGRSWFANGNGGIQVFNCPYWESYGPWNEGLFPSLQDMTTIGTGVTEDSEGDIWMIYDGVYGYAVQIPEGNIENSANWILWDIDNLHPSFQFPEEIHADNSGHVFIRKGWNVFVYSHLTNEWEYHAIGNDLNYLTQSIQTAPDGSTYLAGAQGVNVYLNGVFSYIDWSFLELAYVHQVQWAPNGDMYLCSDKGLWRLQNEVWTNWNEDNSNIPANMLTDIVFVSDEEFYVSGHNTSLWPYYGGIAHFESGQFTPYLEDNSPLPHKQVTDLELDSYGNLWVNCMSEGVALFNPQGISGFDCIDLSIPIDNTIGISKLPYARKELKFYPNPGIGLFHLNRSISPGSHIFVLDLTGKQVYSQYLAIESDLIDLSHLNPGVYICNLDEAGVIQSTKIIIQ